MDFILSKIISRSRNGQTDTVDALEHLSDDCATPIDTQQTQFYDDLNGVAVVVNVELFFILNEIR